MNTNDESYPPVPLGEYARFGSVEAWRRYVDEQRERNAEAKAAWQAKLKREADERAQKLQAERDKANAAAIEQYRKTARSAWIGDDTSFSKAWPELLQRWQMAEVERQAQAEREHLLASGRYERM